MSYEPIEYPSSMIGLRIPVVVPTRWEFLLFLVMIGIFGFMAQVILFLYLAFIYRLLTFRYLKALLTMGLQRETAGRGTMGVYVQVLFNFFIINDFVLKQSTDCVRHNSRAYIL
jgi:hypothetical protein